MDSILEQKKIIDEETGEILNEVSNFFFVDCLNVNFLGKV